MKAPRGFFFAVVFLLTGLRTGYGQCDSPFIGDRGHADLNANAVRARMTASASHFYHEAAGLHYEVPAGNGTRTLWQSLVLIGGFVNGTLAVIEDGQGDTWPGPLDENGDPKADCSPYDHVYKVSLDDLDRYDQERIATRDMLNWPWEAGAPVADGDGIDGNYDLSAGDRPAIEGHQMLWWVVNDKTPSRWPPQLGLEIQVSAFAAQSDDPIVNNATLYRYRLTHHGIGSLTDAYFGSLVVPSLGNFHDGFVGSDTTLGLAYVYNRDDFNEDEGSSTGYGSRPPALGFAILEGFRAEGDGMDNDKDGTIDEAGERLPMSKFVTWSGDGSVTGRPISDQDYYNYLRGLWRDGVPITYGGNGIGFTSIPVDFMYPGEPPDYWSAESLTESGYRDYGGRNFIWSTGPFSMDVGETREIVVAILWAQGENRFDSIRLLKEGVPKMREYYASGFRPTGTDSPANLPEEIPTALTIRQPYPNPSTGLTHFDVGLPQTGRITLTATDLLGRRVATIADHPVTAGWRTIDWNTAEVSNGVYVVHLQAGKTAATAKVVVVR